MPTPAENSIQLHPTVFVIFGITGDLASRKLIPALLHLYSKKLLPQKFAVLGFSRREFSREDFREFIRNKLNIKPGQFKEEDVKHFLDHMSYEQGLFDHANAYDRLSDRLKSIDDRWGQCSNKLFHLSVPPNLYEGILTNVARSGLAKPCEDETGWTRILIEKPFGNDLHTASALDKLLGKLFQENQIFRIDHYLAKEALQNIIAFRFANPIFEAIWNKEHVDKVHIKLFEKSGVEGRGAYYDNIGALRDVGQNHLLQMLALIGMNKPASYSGNNIRKERAKVLKALKPILPRNMKDSVIRGQYEGYVNETGVSHVSQTETYIRLKTFINDSRWKGVPFYIESGKALSDNKTEIDIYFKFGKKSIFSKEKTSPDDANILTFRIQPDEGIKIKFFAKNPGYGFDVTPRTLKFKYSENVSFNDIPNDYERLIRDAFVGDQTLFASTDEILASWKFVTPILENLNKIALSIYAKGAGEVG